MKLCAHEEGVSPVVAVVLLIAVTVLMTVGIYVVISGGFLGGQSTSPTAYSDFSSTDSALTATVMDSGTTEGLIYRVNDSPLVTIENASSVSGVPIDLTRYSQFCEGDEITVIGTHRASETLLQTHEVTTDEYCTLPETSTSSQATFEGDSWIVNTTIFNYGETDDRQYIIVLTDGETTEILDTPTVDSGGQTAVSASSSTFSEGSNVRVGVISPSSGDSDGATLTNNGGSYSWSGGPSAGQSFYQPYSPSSTYSPSHSTDTTSSDASIAPATSEDGTDGGLGLSTSRVAPGESVDLYATLATTKESTEETLVVHATRTNPTTSEVSRSTYTLTAEERRNVTERFAISDPGEYVITASLIGDDETHTAGTLTVIDEPVVTVDSASVSPTTVEHSESFTVTATLTNEASHEETVTVDFFQDGDSQESREVSIPAGGTVTVDRTDSISSDGQYQFHIGVPETTEIVEAGTLSVTADTSVSATLEANPSSVEPDESVTFSASATDDEGDSITKYEWDFGDGTTTTTDTSDPVSHAYSSSGTYAATVTAHDSAGETGTATATVEVRAVNTDGLIAHWAFEDPSTATTARDSSGNHDGVLVNSPRYVTRGDGYALELAGASGDYVDVGTFSNVNSDAISVSSWVKCSAGESGSLLSYATSGEDNEFLFFTPSNTAVYIGGPSSTTGADACGGGFTHLTVTWDSADGSLDVYRNGTHVASKTHQSGYELVSSGYLMLGAEQDSEGGTLEINQAYDGLLDEVRVYNRSLSQEEVSDLYTLDQTSQDATNSEPTAVVNGETTGDTRSAFQFSATDSTDPDGDRLSYTWDFGDGSTAFGESPAHTYATSGEYDVTLTASDGNGGQATQTMTVTVTAAPPQDGLVAYWAFDDPASSTTVIDSVGSADGAIKGTPAYVTRDEGYALSLDGSDGDHVDVGTFSGVKSDGMTVSMWVKCTSSGTEGLFSYAVGSNDNEFLVHDTTGLRGYVGNSHVTSSVQPCTGEYTHITTTWDSSTGNLVMYVDGKNSYSTTHRTDYSLSNNGHLMFGAEQDSEGGSLDNSQGYNGALDNMRVYTRALSAEEVAQLHEAER